MDDLIQVIRTELGISEAIDSETPLISSGVIDSFDIVVLLNVLESNYGVSISAEEIDVEEFDTPRQILSRIESHRG